MAEFIEERLDTAVLMGYGAEDSYMLQPSMTAGGARYVWLLNGKPYREFDLSYIKQGTALALSVASLYHRTYGGFAGFRVFGRDDHTTALDGVGAYTALDCTLNLVSTGVYQLVKEYGRDKPALASVGRPRRVLFKPVAGEIAVAIAGKIQPGTAWTADATTGRVTFAANKSRTTTAISKAAAAVLTVGANTFLVGDSVAIQGVGGMTQINGQRATITAKPTTLTIAVAINSAAFDTYTSGGTVQTRPATGESVTGGCEFDIPCAFDSKFSVTAFSKTHREVSGLRLVELLNPLE